MTVLAARMRRTWASAVGSAAAATGRAVGVVGRTVPGVAGPLLIAYGAYEVYEPLGFIVIGGFLLVLDRRT